MANVLINDAYLENIADAIRTKSGTVLTYKPREMANAIIAIPSGSSGEIDNFSKQLIERTFEDAVAIDVDKVGPYALAGFPEVTSLTCTATFVDNYGCGNNPKLTTVNFPEVTYLDNSAFASNSKLTAVSIPKIRTVYSYAFSNCSKLEKLDLSNQLTELYGSIASNCGKLTAIIIRTNYVPDCVEQANPFPTNFKNTYSGTVPGYIYVPRAMMAAYQGYEGQPQYGRYDYWTMQNYRAIEDYPEICG